MAVFDAICERLKRDSKARCEFSAAIARLIERERPVRACDISGCFWQDIRYPGRPKDGETDLGAR